jgi:hypothetical protein
MISASKIISFSQEKGLLDAISHGGIMIEESG